MPADNEIYNQPGDIWWDEHQPLHAIRTALNPARPACRRNLHDWKQFITPAELRDILARCKLHHHDIAGMSPSLAVPALFRIVRQLKKGKVSYAELGRQARFKLTRDLRISYIGHATKSPR